MMKKSKLVGIFILVAYGVLFTSSVNKFLGFFTEAISGLAVICIAILMYPLFKEFKNASKSYLILKYVEGGLMIVAGIFILINQKASYEFIYSIHVYVFIVSAYLFYHLLYKTKLIPKYISIWGMIAVFLLLIVNILENITSKPSMILYLPIITNEMYIALFLFFKGFNK